MSTQKDPKLKESANTLTLVLDEINEALKDKKRASNRTILGISAGILCAAAGALIAIVLLGLLFWVIPDNAMDSLRSLLTGNNGDAFFILLLVLIYGLGGGYYIGTEIVNRIRRKSGRVESLLNDWVPAYASADENERKKIMEDKERLQLDISIEMLRALDKALESETDATEKRKNYMLDLVEKLNATMLFLRYYNVADDIEIKNFDANKFILESLLEANRALKDKKRIKKNPVPDTSSNGTWATVIGWGALLIVLLFLLRGFLPDAASRAIRDVVEIFALLVPIFMVVFVIVTIIDKIMHNNEIEKVFKKYIDGYATASAKQREKMKNEPAIYINATAEMRRAVEEELKSGENAAQERIAYLNKVSALLQNIINCARGDFKFWESSKFAVKRK